jgi:hypothetical protein
MDHLRERRKERLLHFLPHIRVLGIAHYAYDLDVVLCVVTRTITHHATNRFLRRPEEMSRQLFVHDGNSRRSARVRVSEIASDDDRHLHRREVAGTHVGHLYIQVLIILARVSRNAEVAGGIRIRQLGIRRCSYRAHTRQL